MVEVIADGLQSNAEQQFHHLLLLVAGGEAMSDASLFSASSARDQYVAKNKRLAANVKSLRKTEAFSNFYKLLIINGGQRRDRTADAGLQGRLASELSGLESADIIETISTVRWSCIGRVARKAWQS